MIDGFDGHRGGEGARDPLWSVVGEHGPDRSAQAAPAAQHVVQETWVGVALGI
jgi:hypothetical protein